MENGEKSGLYRRGGALSKADRFSFSKNGFLYIDLFSCLVIANR